MVPKTQAPPTPGQQVEADLLGALAALGRAPRAGARDLFVVEGVTPGGGFVGHQDNAVLAATGFLAASGRVYILGGDVLFEARAAAGDRKLVPLTEGSRVVGGAADHLANLIVCAKGDDHFPAPRSFVELLLRSELLLGALPRIVHYARRPVFDRGLVLRGPGWHPGVGILVHGPAVDPTPWATPPAGTPALGRLPPHLRELFGEFCFRSDADVANAVGLLLTVLLLTRYTATGKPIGLLDGNRPGLGKTLLGRVLGVVGDGLDPKLLRYSENEEELQKTVCATLRAGAGSVLVLDNAKVAAGATVSSPALESWVTAPTLDFRILGVSELYSRPNDVLFVLTMNDTKASQDLVSRGVPVRLAFEGDPADRPLAGDPVAFARDHRVELLGELAGMVQSWTTAGRPAGGATHRFKEWAAEVGGILRECGFPEFLTNMREAAGEFSAELDDLAALAEVVVRRDGPGLERSETHPRRKPIPAGDWVALAEEAGVGAGHFREDSTPRAKGIRVGKVLTRNVGRTVQVTGGRVPTVATLRSLPGRAREKTYFFELNTEGETGSGLQSPPAADPRLDPTPATRPETGTPPILRGRKADAKSHRDEPVTTPASGGGPGPGNSEAWA